MRSEVARIGVGPLGRLVASGLIAASFLPQDLRWCVVLATIIVLGVPHGALDGEIARPVLRPRLGRAWVLAFALPYLVLAGAVLLAWRAAPMPTLAAFLAVSVWHFGREDGGEGLGIASRGGLAVALPVLIHPAATAHIFGVVAGVALHRPPPWLRAASLLWVPAAVAASWNEIRSGNGHAVRERVPDAAAFVLLPPIVAFGLYFVLVHAPSHTRGLIADPLRAPRVGDRRAARCRALPWTLVTIGLGAALWPSYSGPLAERLMALTIQGLAALTLPHLLLELLSERVPARVAREPALGATRAVDRQGDRHDPPGYPASSASTWAAADAPSAARS